ncbi:12294_t:CDS:1, partial [Acaulospora morrowiae]
MEEEMEETFTSIKTCMEEKTYKKLQQTSEQQALEKHQILSFGRYV